MQLPGYQPSIGTQGMILRYFCTISPLLFIRISVLYGAFFGCSSCRSPVSENTPHTLALRQAAAKISVSSPGTAGGGLVHLLGVVHDPVRAVLGEDDQIHAGQADLHALDHLADLAGVVEHFLLGVQARHLVVDDRDADGVVTARNISV